MMLTSYHQNETPSSLTEFELICHIVNKELKQREAVERSLGGIIESTAEVAIHTSCTS